MNKDGSYFLYSDGWNLNDDGGTVDEANRMHLHSKGDWVWRFPTGNEPAMEPKRRER